MSTTICPNCNKSRHGKLIDLGLENETYYFKIFQCRCCSTHFKKLEPLILPEDGAYSMQTGLDGKLHPLHWLVWQWFNHEEIDIGTIIHHLNNKKRDNRPHNLYKMDTGHSAYLSPNSNKILIKVLRKRVKELEEQLCQKELFVNV